VLVCTPNTDSREADAGLLLQSAPGLPQALAPVARGRPRLLRAPVVQAALGLAQPALRPGAVDSSAGSSSPRASPNSARTFGRPPRRFQPPSAPAGKINLSDLDSRNVKTSRGWVQGYNAQAVCTEDQIVIAAEVTVDSPDFGHVEPMVAAARNELARAALEHPPEVVLADAGYWHQAQMERLLADGVTVLIPPDAKNRADTRRAGTAAPTRSCVACSRPSPAARSTPSARR
jgi:hypothetical protein